MISLPSPSTAGYGIDAHSVIDGDCRASMYFSQASPRAFKGSWSTGMVQFSSFSP